MKVKEQLLRKYGKAGYVQITAYSCSERVPSQEASIAYICTCLTGIGDGNSDGGIVGRGNGTQHGRVRRRLLLSPLLKHLRLELRSANEVFHLQAKEHVVHDVLPFFLRRDNHSSAVFSSASSRV